MTARYSFLLPLLLLPFLFSCKPSQQVVGDGSVQKRKYNSGWHVSNTGSDLDEPEGYESDKEEEKVNPDTNSDKSTSESAIASSTQEPKRESNPSLSITDDKGAVAGFSSKGDQKEKENLQENCAVIRKRGGEKIKAKVKTVGTDKIKYKKCDRPDGPTYTIDKSEVFMIKYPNKDEDVYKNGTKGGKEREEYLKGDNSKEAKNAEEDSGKDRYGILGFILSILSLISLVVFFATISFGSLLAFIGTIRVWLFILAFVFASSGLIFSAIGDSEWGTAGLVLSIIELGVIGIPLLVGLAGALLL